MARELWPSQSEKWPRSRDEVGSGAKQRHDGPELRGIVARVLQCGIVIARVPQLGIEGLLGGAEGNVEVAPEGVDTDGMVSGGVRPSVDGVDQVGG